MRTESQTHIFIKIIRTGTKGYEEKIVLKSIGLPQLCKSAHAHTCIKIKLIKKCIKISNGCF